MMDIERMINVLEKEIGELEKAKGLKESKDPRDQEKLDNSTAWLIVLKKERNKRERKKTNFLHIDKNKRIPAMRVKRQKSRGKVWKK